jgi:hypothetical protein
MQQSCLREKTGITVVGVWERGRFEIPTAATTIHSTTVLLLAGAADQLNNYHEHIGRHEKFEAPGLVLGGGTVGLALAYALHQAGLDYRIIEKRQKLVEYPKHIHGSVADIHILTRAGIERTPSITITTHDDTTSSCFYRKSLCSIMNKYNCIFIFVEFILLFVRNSNTVRNHDNIRIYRSRLYSNKFADGIDHNC